MPASEPPSRRASGERAATWLTLGLVVAFAVGLSVFEINNDDAGFHTATGRWIRATGEVPDRNPFSYARDGAHWTQHQWIPAVAISWVADSFGARGLIIAKTACVGLLMTVAALFVGGLSGYSVAAPWPAAILAISAAAGAFRFKERPLLVSVLALVITVGLLLRWRRARFAGHRLPLAAAVVAAVTMQLHAGGLYALLVKTAARLGRPRKRHPCETSPRRAGRGRPPRAPR